LVFVRRVSFVTNIYVGNLAFAASDEDLRSAFEQYGEVTSVNIIMDRETGRSRGFAFVEMSSSEQANEAIENLDGVDIAGRNVRVNEARPRAPRSGGGGGGGGYRGGGGGGGGGGYRGGGGGGGGHRGGGRDGY
jgi:RNA recognition motif-containing protein